MHRLALVMAAAVVVATPALASARGHGGHSSSRSHRSHASGATHHSSASSHGGFRHSGAGTIHAGGHATRGTFRHAPPSHKATGVHHHSHGNTRRDPEQRAKFMRTHPCPSTGKTHGACPGYVVDHVQALKHGGRDDPSNMQWQSVRAAKAKDKVE